MFVTTHTFERVSGYAIANIACTGCGALNRKEVRSECTINPYNKIDGEVATRDQVREQATASAKREATRLEQKGRICTKCKLAAAPDWMPDRILHSDLLVAVEDAKKLEEQIKQAKAIHEVLAKSFVGRDIMVGGKSPRLAQVTDVSYYDRGEWTIGYRLYSQSRNAAPGELLTDTLWSRLDERIFSGG